MPSVGKNIPHDSAAGHVSGQSIFLDDLPPTAGELLVDFLGSPVAHGKIRSVDLSAAAAIPGVILLTHKDIPGHNDVGPVMKDEHILAEKEGKSPIKVVRRRSRGRAAKIVERKIA